MAKYYLQKNNNHKSTGYNKYYPKRVPEGIIDIEGLSARMAGRTSTFSEGEIKGMITDLTKLMLELTFAGYSVKLDGLALFWIHPKAKGVFDAKETDPSTFQTKLRARATGIASNKAIGTTRAGGVTATWEEVGNYTSPRTPEVQTEP